MNIETVIDAPVAWLNQLYGLPAIALVFLSCIVLGYVLKLVKRFPNDGIPLAVILWGAIFLPLLTEYTPGGLRIWLLKNILVGVIAGFIAWLFHNKILAKIEDKLGLFQSDGPDQPPKTP